jgi:hypothetical protein
MTALLIAALFTLVILTQVEIHHISEIAAGRYSERPMTESESILFHHYN